MTALRRLAGALTTLLALAILLGLVAGVPLLLVLAIGWPLPHALPSWGEIGMWLETQGWDTTTVLHILAVLLWVLWAYLICGLVAHALHAARGGRARRRRWVTPSQRFAGVVIALVILGITLTTRPGPTRAPSGPLSAALAAPRATVAGPLHPARAADVVAPSSPSPTAAPTLSAGGGTPAPTDQTVEVRPGDSLWAIAGREYRDPAEWTRIWDANQGHVEDDGRTFTDPSLIFAGWELDVPDVLAPPSPATPPATPATTSPPSPAAPQPPAAEPSLSAPAASSDQEVTVHEGDTLWGLAGREYGNPYDWTRIWDANQGHVEDNGYAFTDPGKIDVGWQLDVPALNPPTPESGTPTQPTQPSPVAAPTPPPSPPNTATPSPGSVFPTGPAGTAPPAPHPTQVPPLHTHAPAHPQANPPSWTVTLAEGGSLAALTALALGALLVAAQRHERWRRRPGDPVAPRVARLAQRPSMRRIRAALADAQAGASGDGAGESTGRALQAGLDALQVNPGRVILGEERPGAPLAVDIPHLHGVALTGPGAAGAARGVLVSLLSHHGVENAEVVLSDRVARSLLTLPESTPGLTSSPFDMLLSRLEAEITYQSDALRRDHQTSWVERLGGPDPLPAFLALISTDDISPAHLPRLTAAVEAARAVAIAVVLLGDAPPDAPWVRAVPVGVDGSVPGDCAPLLGGTTALHSLSPAEASELLSVIACGRGPDLVPDIAADDEDDGEVDDGADQEEALDILPDLEVESPPLARAEAAAEAPAPPAPLVLPRALEPRRIDIRIYGRPRVLVDGHELLKGLPVAGRQVLALLCVRGELTEQQGVEALGAGSPDPVWRGRWAKGTRSTRAALRDALGDQSVDPIPSTGGVFRLNPEVVGSDYARLVAGRALAKPIELSEHRLAILARATDGVAGEPFAQADYNWLVDHQEHVRNLAIDTLNDLAQLQAAAGDLDAAIDTLDRALSVNPDPVEDLFRQQIVWQHRLGRKETARDLYRRLLHQLSERCDRTPSEETVALMESLESAPRVMGR